ncbi:MAG: DUF3536 domain-containing protein [Actinomycetota bacterium]
MAARIAVHAHFYQPPRENPWTGEIDEQPDAEPFHDWNERVHEEAYRPNAFASIPTARGDETVNNFERLSFDVGPTLLAWMEAADRETYERIVEADSRSVERLGHGNAMAQAFHHTILPLAPRRDLYTQLRWGIADFAYRFGRPPEGLWLPETAADAATLDALIDEGIAFTVLAPHQIARWREHGGAWVDVDEHPADTRVPYSYRHGDGSGRALALFPYDGGIAQEIAFRDAASSGEGLLDLFGDRLDDESGRLVHAATDGETYGHHRKFADLGLAYALFVEAERRGWEVTNYGRHLADHPPRHEAELAAGATSWSCAHGVGRWSTDCGCATGGEPGWNQSWREPLRAALDLVRDAADDAFDRMALTTFEDPWAVRDRYVEVVIGQTEVEEFIWREAGERLSGGPMREVHDLLELQRNSMSMFTSCGWFFHDVSGIETQQVLRYAGRTLELLRALGAGGPEEAFLARLEEARSNDPERGTGADVFRSVVMASR